MPGLAEPERKKKHGYMDDEREGLDDTITALRSTEAADFEQVPPTRVGSVEDSETSKSAPLVFYVEDKRQRRLRIAAAALFALLVALVMLGNWLQSWEPAPPAGGAAQSLTNGAPANAVSLPADGSRERAVRPAERTEAAAQF